MDGIRWGLHAERQILPKDIKHHALFLGSVSFPDPKGASKLCNAQERMRSPSLGWCVVPAELMNAGVPLIFSMAAHCPLRSLS